MNQLTIASSRADAAAAEAFEHHHAQMLGALAVKVESLSTAARSGWSGEGVAARDDIVAWARTELLPHARAEESTIYASAAEHPSARLLVEAMRGEHEVIGSLVDRLAAATDAIEAALAAGGLRTLVESHISKENDQLLPLLVEDPRTSVTELLGGMHDALGHEASAAADLPAPNASGGHTCSCGEAEEAGYPQLDARAIPHAIRHATIFGALDALHAGQGLVLVAPHDPLPLLAQIEDRSPGRFAVDYLERGPEKWQLSFVRTTS